MHGDLAWIKGAHPHGAIGAAGAEPGNQSGARAIYKVRIAEVAVHLIYPLCRTPVRYWLKIVPQGLSNLLSLLKGD